MKASEPLHMNQNLVVRENILFFVLVAALSLLSSELAIWGMLTVRTSSLEASVSSSLSYQDVAVDPYKAAQNITNLERMGVISCAELYLVNPKPVTFLNNNHRPDCKKRKQFWFNKKNSVNAIAANGATWVISFLTPISSQDHTLFWLVRLLSLVAALSIGLFIKIREVAKISISKERSAHLEKINLVYRQVAHDLRSPLSALNTLSFNAEKGLQDNTGLLKLVIQRISNMADSLLENSMNAETRKRNMSAKLIVNDIREAITQKNLEPSLKNVAVSFEHDGSISQNNIPIAPEDFSRIVSNMINNSVEANSTIIKLSSKMSSNFLDVDFIDNGKGFPEEALSSIGKAGASFGKAKGNGLGLSHAHQIIVSLGGTVQVENLKPSGARVTLRIPTTSPT